MSGLSGELRHGACPALLPRQQETGVRHVRGVRRVRDAGPAARDDQQGRSREARGGTHCDHAADGDGKRHAEHHHGRIRLNVTWPLRLNKRTIVRRFPERGTGSTVVRGGGNSGTIRRIMPARRSARRNRRRAANLRNRAGRRRKGAMRRADRSLMCLVRLRTGSRWP